MKFSRRAEIFRQAKAEHTGFLASVLWKLTGDRELFTEAMQNALLGMWQHVEKLDGEKAGAYIYRIALTANSKAWRNRIGKDGQFSRSQIGIDKSPDEELSRDEMAAIVRREISRLPAKQGRAIVMRYLEQQGYKAIAENLRCGEAGARSHVSKAVAALRKKLKTFAEQEH